MHIPGEAWSSHRAGSGQTDTGHSQGILRAFTRQTGLPHTCTYLVKHGTVTGRAVGRQTQGIYRAFTGHSQDTGLPHTCTYLVKHKAVTRQAVGRQTQGIHRAFTRQTGLPHTCTYLVKHGAVIVVNNLTSVNPLLISCG
jgi:hypothetical protein